MLPPHAMSLYLSGINPVLLALVGGERRCSDLGGGGMGGKITCSVGQELSRMTKVKLC